MIRLARNRIRACLASWSTVCWTSRRARVTVAPREAWLLTDNKDVVARQLHIAPTTVRTHLQRVRAKYAAVGRPARSKAALVARAIQEGLIDIDDL